MPDDSFNYAQEIEHLENAGVNPSEAKAIVGMAERAVNSGAQKSDIELLNGKIELLNGKIELLNGKIDAEIKSVRSDIALLHKDIQHLDEKVNANYTALDTKIDNVHTALDTKIDSSQAFYIAEMKAAISRSTNLILTCILAAVIGVFSIFFAFFG
ncbi:MAG: hypothetical protein OXC62_06565 [Aestuariivita sp.]|nr:hypothetical protein [Aestuariivita sp.]